MLQTKVPKIFAVIFFNRSFVLTNFITVIPVAYNFHYSIIIIHFMEINKLIEIVKEKISKEIILQEINVEDKSFLHKDHKNNSPNKFHIKISIISDELKPKKKIDTTKRIYKILENELKNHIHSIQLSIN